MGTEGGELLSAIVERKEHERLATGGIFLWGIGNSVATAVLHLAELDPRPAVLFSLTRTRPRSIDARPDRRVVWTGAATPDGRPYRIPRGTRVMGGVVDGRRVPARFALVCESAEPLALGDLGTLDFDQLRNLMSGKPIGASQVTAVVAQADSGSGAAGRYYQVAMEARLVPPYVVRLTDPVVVEDGPTVRVRDVRMAESHPQLTLPGLAG